MTPSDTEEMATVTRLYRAVMELELIDFKTRGAFFNPRGIEVKYFATSQEDAQRYANLAATAYGEGPFTIMEATIRADVPSADMKVQADGIACIVLPTTALLSLTKVRIMED